MLRPIGNLLTDDAFYLQLEQLLYELANKGAAMGLAFYFVMFLVACGFGWWAKGADKSR